MELTTYPAEALNSDIRVVLPEILMAVLSMALLMVGAFRTDRAADLVNWLAVITLGIAAAVVLILPEGPLLAFNGAFVLDPFARFAKILIIGGAAAAIILSRGYLVAEKMMRFEYPVLVLLAALGMMMMVSANDLISLYVGLELQSLALYVLAGYNRDSLRSSEAGLKYFVLGALSSGLLLYGASLLYGYTGTTLFSGLETALMGQEAALGPIFGIVFLMAGLAFKISAVPFHMWTPDVYEGSPTPVTAFFALAPKIAAVALLVRVLMGPLAPMAEQWQAIVIFLSIASMAIGAFGAIGQQNIKRLMAYSTIGHMGYLLVGVAAGASADAGIQANAVRGVLIYLLVYVLTNAGVFVCILSMRRKEGMVEQIGDLAGLSRSQPVMAMVLAAFMFSLAGIPPLAGFLSKWYVFVPAAEAGLYPLVVIGVLTSVIAFFYYLRIVKIMYFDEPAEPFVTPMPTTMTAILAVSGFATIFFAVFAAPLIAAAGAAGRVVFG